MTQELAQAFGDVLSLQVLAYIAFGVFIGYLVGALPGMNRATAIALLLPFTYKLAPLVSISFLIGINKGGAAGCANGSGCRPKEAQPPTGYSPSRRWSASRPATGRPWPRSICNTMKTLRTRP